MKKKLTLLALLLIVLTTTAQTLNVKTGSVTWQFPAAQTGEMTYSDGNTLTIMGKTFTLSDISSMTVDNTQVADGSISVTYSNTSAAVTVAGNIAQYVNATVSGAHVSIEQSDELEEEITYTLSGTSTDGEFYMSGSYKSTIELNGLTLTNVSPVYSGAAVHIQNGKRIKVKVVTGTTNTLTDAASGSQKGCLYIKGHAEFAQKGTLNIVGNVKHGIKTGEYMTLKNATLNVTSAVTDGISCNEYFLMESGTINISGTGDEGIQCEVDGESSTGETTDHEDEDSGNIYILDGTITVNCTAAETKGIKSQGDMTISGGTINVTTSGRNSEGIESKSYMNITGGHITVNAYDDALNSAKDLTISSGYIYARATNNDGIDANGNLYIKGGVIYAIGTTQPEVAIDVNSEQQKKLYVTGGTLVAIGGLESGSSLSQTCYSSASWSKNTWYALYDGGNLALAFKTPSSGGTTLVVSTGGTTTLASDVTVSGGTDYFGGVGNIGGTISGGSSVTLSEYTANGNNPGGGGFPGGGGGGFPGGGGPGGH